MSTGRTQHDWQIVLGRISEGQPTLMKSEKDLCPYLDRPAKNINK